MCDSDSTRKLKHMKNCPYLIGKTMWLYVRTKFLILQLMITGAFGFVNVAHNVQQNLQGMASMSDDPVPNTDWTAPKVIDGNTNQSVIGGSCAIMDFSKNYRSVWLKVQLELLFNVAYIQIFFRNEGTLYRSSGFTIYAFVNDTFNPQIIDPQNIVYHHDPMSGCLAPIQNITVNRLARQIVFTNQRPAEFQYLCFGENSNLFTSIEICEIIVMGCNSVRYSPGCINICPFKCKNRHCDAFNGSCAEGCTDPSALTADCIVCATGQYISNGQCVSCKGHCKIGTYCNKLTGRCNHGCEAQWTGDFCELCIDHFYGYNCNTACGYCSNSDPCHKSTGHCPNGCQRHWAGDKCDVCSDHFYGNDCNPPCGHCKDNDVCNKTNGHCPNGCQIQWTGERCDECVSYKYGPNCAFDCGHCKDGRACAAENGVCSDGCDYGWIGDLCVTAKLNALELDTRKDELNATGVATIASLATLFAISLFIIFLMGRYIMKIKNNRHHENVPVPKREKSPQTYFDLSVMDDNHAYSTIGSTVSKTPYNVIGDSRHNI